MTTISKEEILELNQIHDANCISIFIPTHRAGEATLQREDALTLKNQVKDIKNKLAEKGLGPVEVDKLVKPMNELISEGEYWRHQAGGLAIFAADGFFREYRVPFGFNGFNYVSNELYLTPLLHSFYVDGVFYLLTIKPDEVKFYEGSKYSLNEIMIQENVPARLEEVVGYDYEQKGFQFRAPTATKGTYNARGENETESKNELLRYFQAIDAGLMASVLQGEQKIPLLVCCLDFQFPIYQEANTYPGLFPLHLSGNPAFMNTAELHKEAWDILEHYFRQGLQDKIEQFREFQPKGKASAELQDIIPAAYYGKVDTLFIEKGTEIFGFFDPTTQETFVEEKQQVPNISLVNLGAMKVFEQGGSVYLMEKDEMPDNSSGFNALFRY
ncbi:MAG TPA: hypothetical protein VK152_12275 [Paludibacter sp.]|nr:hypothetical protein [Paludibacter sp.]